MMRRALYIILASFATSGLTGQINNEIIRLAVEIAELNDDPAMLEELTESLLILSEDPVAINSATEAQISQIIFLTEFQVKSLAGYIRNTGPVRSLYEISYIPGFDAELASLLAPYVTLEVRNHLRPAGYYPRQRIMTRLMWRPEPEQDFTSERRLYARYRLDVGGVSTGFTLENDAGEVSFPVNREPPDFISAFVMVTVRNVPLRLIVGDYSLRTGQGVVMNTSFRTGISTLSQSLLVQKNDLRPYTSSGENMFMRGVAGTYDLKRLQITGFLSQNRTDATLWTDTPNGEESIRSFYTSGLHDNVTNLLKKDAVTIFTTGAVAEWDAGVIRAGVSGAVVRFSKPFSPDRSSIGRSYLSEGVKHDFLSLFFKYNPGKILAWGEISADHSGDISLVTGMKIIPRKGLGINASLRRYPPGFYTYHGNPVSVYSPASNETGMTASLTASLVKNITVEMGTDLCWRSEPKGTTLPFLPRVRTDLRIIADHSDYLKITIIFQHRESDEPATSSDPYFTTMRESSNLFSISPLVKTGERLTLSARYIIKETRGSNQTGMLFYLQGRLSLPGWETSLWGRFTGYDTDGYESRIYAWEDDLVSTFNVSLFTGRGTSSYIMIENEFLPKLFLRLKYSVRNGLANDGSMVNGRYLNLQLRGTF